MNDHRPLGSFGRWKLVKLLGVGAFGEVHHWKNIETNEEIATKRLKSNAKLMPDEINVMCKRWLKEVKWMREIQTCYIVGTVEVKDEDFLDYLLQHNPDVGCTLPVIIMQFCNDGDLRSHLNKIINFNGLTEFEVRNILQALLEAIRYLHEVYNIEHRDIKPENIVCHKEENKKVYKLSDFGYAREIPERTVAQSIVGTRNYVAPEVIDGGTYTKTVDYWSIGNVVYEVICGIQPFIPHQTLYNRIKNIQQKPPDCIAIMQNIDHPKEDKFEFLNYIRPQHNLSTIFIKDLEEWLRVTMKNDYRQRGYNKHKEFVFYDDMKRALSTKILTVFSMKTYTKYYYDIETFANLQEFINKISYDTGIIVTNIFLIYPPCHPKRNSPNTVDYFVQEWCDTSNKDNPPVMLFVDEFIQQDNCYINPPSEISEILQKCMNLYPEFDELKPFLLDQFEKDVHFVITNSQHQLECYLMGLHNYILEIEHNVLKYNGEIGIFNTQILEVNGIVKHFHVVLNELIQKERISKTEEENGGTLIRKCLELKNNQLPIIINKYQEISSNCRQMATCNIYEKYAKSDIYSVVDYQKFLLAERSLEERLERGQRCIDKWFDTVKNFYRSSECYDMRLKLNEQIKNFVSLREFVRTKQHEISHLEREINNFTLNVLRNEYHINTLPAKMSSLHVDGSLNSLTKTTSCSLNVFDNETEPLLNEFNSTIKSMEEFMDED